MREDALTGPGQRAEDVALRPDEQAVAQPNGPAVFTLATNTWLTMAFARASTSSWARSGVVVWTGLRTTSAPIQARCRVTSGNQAS